MLELVDVKIIKVRTVSIQSQDDHKAEHLLNKIKDDGPFPEVGAIPGRPAVGEEQAPTNPPWAGSLYFRKTMLKQQGTVKKVKVISEKTRNEIWGKFLTQQGEYTDWYCIIRKNCMLMRQIYYKSPILYSCGFRSSCTIVDACSLPFRDGSSGIVMAVNNEQSDEYFLAYYSIKMSRIIKKILIRRKISKVVTVLDATKKNEIECLHGNLKNSPHLVAVGTYGGDCYLAHFGIDLPDVTDPELGKAPFSSNLCKTFISHGRFNFVANNGAVYPISIDEIHITAIIYLERCRTVIIGFSCGAFITVNLVNGNDASYYYSSSPIYSFSCQEPMDDPRPVLYLWVAYSRGKRKNPYVMLFVINFPNDEGHLPNEWTFNDLVIISYLTWCPENCTEWLSFRTIVSPLSREHTAKNNISERLPNTEESFLRVNVTDTSRVLMIWKTTNSIVEGALFDLNAFYYKRLPRQVIFTESFLKFNPFLCLFTLPITNNEQTCLDYLVNYSGVWQHQSPYSETNDFFIFAPSYSFEIVAFNGNLEFTIFVPSIQKVVLKWLDENFEDAIGQKSALACSYLNSVGLAKTSADISDNCQTSTVPLENESIVISSLLFNGEINDTIRKNIIICPNYHTIHQIASLIWKEVVNAKQKFDELSEPWFDRIPRALSAADMYWLRTSASVFHCAAELFAEISKRVPSEKVAEATTANYNMMASKNLVFYTNIVFLFHHGGLLPLKNYTALNARMKAKVDERKQRSAPGSKLYIVNLLEEMQSACPDEIFWCGLTADEWYPPNSIGALLSAILAIKITETSKYKLIGYFLLDYDDLVGKEPKVFDRFKWRFPYKNQAMCNQIELNWKNDCGLEGPAIKHKRIASADTKAEEPICEVDRLMKRLLLNKKEIEFIKENLLKRPNGIREWNRFCLRRKMFARLLPAKKPKNGILIDRCDRWTAKILEDFPIIQMDNTYPRSIFPAVQNSVNGGKMVRDTPPKQWAASHPYLSPAIRSHDKRAVLETPRRLNDVVSKPIVLEVTPKTTNCPTSPVYDRRISNYERILSKEDLENVQRLLQTPTPRRRHVPGIRTENLFASPTADQFSSVPLPTSILKTRKERQHENASADESQFKSLRFDLPNSIVSNCESNASNTSQMEEQKYDDPLKMNNVKFLNPHNLDTLKFTHTSKEVSLEEHKGKKRGSIDVVKEKNPHDISVEEQSDSDIVDGQERQSKGHEKVMEYCFEEQEEIDLQNKTELVNKVEQCFEEQDEIDLQNKTKAVNEVEHYFEEQEDIEDLQDKTEPVNEIPLIQENRTALATISYEEQEDPGILLNAGNEHIISDVRIESEQNMQNAGDVPENNSALATTKISRHATTVEINIYRRSSKKRSAALNDDLPIKSEDNIASNMDKLLHKKISFEQEDETDPTSTEIEKVTTCRLEMESTNICRELSEGGERETYSPIPEMHKSLRAASSTNTGEISERASSAAKDAANDEQAIQIYSNESFQLSSSGIEISTSSHRMFTRSAAKAKKLMSLSPEANVALRKRLESESSSSHSPETTPRRSTRTTSIKGSLKIEKTRRKRPESRKSSSRSRETTPKRLTRATSLAEGSPKTEKTRRKDGERQTSSSRSRETTPKRLTRASSLAEGSPKIEKIRQKGSKKRISSLHSKQVREITPKRLIRVTPSIKNSPIEETRRKRRESETNSTPSFESTSEQSTRLTISDRNSPVRKSLRCSRTQSEQIEDTTPKASPNRRRRAISEESQLNETLITSHPMLTRSARKARSEGGSPPKQRILSGFEPTLAKIDELPKKSSLRVGRKTVAQVLEEKMK
ncbi:Protein mel-28 [Dirofilaria immitis]